MTETSKSEGAAGVLLLPEELTIYTASGLRADWLAWLADQRDDVLIDASGVTQIDAAGVQLLVSLLRSVEARVLGWRMKGLGGALREAIDTLGLGARLGSEPVAAALD